MRSCCGKISKFLTGFIKQKKAVLRRLYNAYYLAGYFTIKDAVVRI
jgi:hypothetical protein